MNKINHVVNFMLLNGIFYISYSSHSTLLERCPRPISEEKRRMLKNLAIRLEAGLVKDASSRVIFLGLMLNFFSLQKSNNSSLILNTWT